MTFLYFYEAAFGACSLLLLVSYAALAAARREGDGRRLYLLHLLRAGLSLSAASYLLRVMGALHYGHVSALSFVTGLLGTLFLWLGWMEHWKLRNDRPSAPPVARAEDEDLSLPETLLMPPLAAGGSALTARTRLALHHAQREACRRHDRRVETDHLLLGLLYDPGSAGVHVLGALGVEPERIHLELLCRMTPHRKFSRKPGQTPDTRTPDAVALTERAGEVLALAAREARRFDKASVGTEHLLLGLALVGKGNAAAVLFAEGVTVDALRAEIVKARKAA